MNLPCKQVIELQPASPFNFDATLHKPDHFLSADNAWQPGARWQTMRWQNRPLGLKFENRGDAGQPRVGLSIWSLDQLNQDYANSLMAEITYRRC